MPIGILPKGCAYRENIIPPPRTRTSRTLSRKNRDSRNMPVLQKDYSAHTRLLTHMELLRPKGNKNTEICLKLNAEDSSKLKSIQVQPEIRRNMHELCLRPEKSAYRLHPTIRTKRKDRLQQKSQKMHKRRTNTTMRIKNNANRINSR